MIVTIVGLNAADAQIIFFVLNPVAAGTGANGSAAKIPELQQFVDRKITVIKNGHLSLCLNGGIQNYLHILATARSANAAANAAEAPGCEAHKNTDDSYNYHQFYESEPL